MINTPWKQRSADPGFGYAGGFQDILTAFNGLNHRGAETRYHDNQHLFVEQIGHLTKLKQDLLKDEKNFFELFGIKGEDTRKSFQNLKDKIDEWNKTGAWKLINDNKPRNEFYKGLQLLKHSAILDELDDATWQEMLEASLDSDTL
jgi:hypothetical protein